MSAHTPTPLLNPEGLGAEEILSSFERWLSRGLDEARAAGGDLAFCDRPMDHLPGRDPELIGWEHVILQKGAPPPGGGWTVYRLHGAGGQVTCRAATSFWVEVEPLLAVLGYRAAARVRANGDPERRRAPSALDRLIDLDEQIAAKGDPSGLRRRLRRLLLSELELLGIVGRRQEDRALAAAATRARDVDEGELEQPRAVAQANAN